MIEVHRFKTLVNQQFFLEMDMELKGKKVIIIGERDGVQGPAIEACVRSAGAEPVLTQTQCFV